MKRDTGISWLVKIRQRAKLSGSKDLGRSSTNYRDGVLRFRTQRAHKKQTYDDYFVTTTNDRIAKKCL